MPYIKSSARDRLLETGDALNPGELNYVITKIIHLYLENGGSDYQHYNDVIGVLESAKLELYRRYVAPYEDMKKEQNGDI